MLGRNRCTSCSPYLPFKNASLVVRGNAQYDTVIFISTGNRASYCVFLFEDLAQKPVVPVRIRVCMIIADIDTFGWYEGALRSCSELCQAKGTIIEIWIFVTGKACREGISQNNTDILLSDRSVLGKCTSECDRMVGSLEIIEQNFERRCLSQSSICRSEITRDVTRDRSLDARRQAVHEDETGLLADEKRFSPTKKCCSSSVHTQILTHGSPEAETMIREPILQSSTTEKICVVAAVPAALAASISTRVCRYIAAAKEDDHSGSIKLWIELNR